MRLFMQFLLVCSLIGTFLLPSVELISGFPKFEISDILFPFLIILCFIYHREQLFMFIGEQKRGVGLFLIFLLLAILSIGINGRLGEIRDWFEIIKYVKFLAFIFLFLVLLSYEEMLKILKVLFCSVFIFNLFHYFNILNFNALIEPAYAAKHHLDFFGLNSIGQPATKRALGTMGNPNNNGFMFLAFLVIFLPRNNNYSKFTELIFPSLAIAGIFMCQSRTGLIAYVLLMLFYFISTKSTWKRIAFYTSLTVVLFLAFQFFGNSYLGSIGNMTSMKSAGIGRFEQWKRIIELMPGHWFFGYGPNKQLFELNGIYAESEYFLLLFRYGALGLLTFIFSLYWFGKQNSQRIFKEFSFIQLTLLIYFVVSITNTPLHSAKLLVIISLLLSIGILLGNGREKKV